MKTINQVIRTLGLMGIMMALAGFFAAANSASAADITTATPLAKTGQVVVYAEASPASSNMTRIDLAISDGQGNTVAKGVIYGSGKFSAELPTGNYKVALYAKGYDTFSQAFNIAPDGTAVVKATLAPTCK